MLRLLEDRLKLCKLQRWKNAPEREGRMVGIMQRLQKSQAAVCAVQS